MSEAELEEQLVELAKLHGWRLYHVHDSRTDDWRADHGFPDWILLRGDRMLALELKTTTGRLTDQQLAWLQAFAAVRSVAAAVVRPARSLDELEALLR